MPISRQRLVLPSFDPLAEYVVDRVFVAAIYATDGRLLGRGSAGTEGGARYCAVNDWARKRAKADDLNIGVNYP